MTYYPVTNQLTMLDPRTRKRKRRRRQRLVQEKQSVQFNWFMFIMTGLSWLTLIFIVVNVEPTLLRDIPYPGWYGPFFVTIFAAIFSLIRLLAGNLKRALLVATLITVFLILRINYLGQWYNAVLLTLLGLAVECFWISQFRFNWLDHLITQFKGHQPSDDVVESSSE